MASVQFSGFHAPPLAYAAADAAYAAEAADDEVMDLGRELGRHSDHQPYANEAPRKPLRMALSAIRENLDRRTREWRGSAKVVEQSLRQLVAAESSRAQALDELRQVEVLVERTGQLVTEALASFDESDQGKDIDPLFEHSQRALDDLDRVTNDLSIAQHWCRTAWRQYAQALEQEQLLRYHIQSSDLAS
jgi:hypothetical protein